MNRTAELEIEAFRAAWDKCDTLQDAFNAIGIALRQASGNPRMRQFRQEIGESAFQAYFNELYPVSDEDIDYVMGKLAWQAARVHAQLPKLPLSRYKEARAAVAQDKALTRYVERANGAAQSAWIDLRYLSLLPDLDERAVDFVQTMRRLGLPTRDMQFSKLCSFVLACRPSFLASGQLRTASGSAAMQDYMFGSPDRVAWHLIELLHTSVPSRA